MMAISYQSKKYTEGIISGSNMPPGGVQNRKSLIPNNACA